MRYSVSEFAAAASEIIISACKKVYCGDVKYFIGFAQIPFHMLYTSLLVCYYCFDYNINDEIKQGIYQISTLLGRVLIVYSLFIFI